MATDEKTQTSSCELEMGYQTTVVSSNIAIFLLVLDCVPLVH
jgi:hypothetical protein